MSLLRSSFDSYLESVKEPKLTDELTKLASEVGSGLETQGMRLATCESCTGGWVAKVITDTAGSSNWFDCGFVTYSNKSKEEMLGVNPKTLQLFGAVSETVVSEMVKGALERSSADIALAISGIAGPDGGTADKPVGTVWFALGFRDLEINTSLKIFSGTRDEVRQQAVLHALTGVSRKLNG